MANIVVKEKFKTVNWNDASNLGLIDEINNQVLHPIGMSITRNEASGTSPCLLQNSGGKWEYQNDYEVNAVVRDGTATFFDNGEPQLKASQIDFLVKFNDENSSGHVAGEDSVHLACIYFLDKSRWDTVTKYNKYTSQKKALGKTLARRLIKWHNTLTLWPTSARQKLELLNNVGKKKVSENVINATVLHIDNGMVINKAATINGCFHQSVKSVLAKIEKFDDATKRYSEL